MRRLALAAPAGRVPAGERRAGGVRPAGAGRAPAGSRRCWGPRPPPRCCRSRRARNALRLTGYAAAPTVTRATAAAQALVVNGRPVADPVLRTAVRVAYRDVIAPGRHPVVALFLDLPPEELDVNVHPAKAEVRFRDAGEVRALVISALGARSPAGRRGGAAGRGAAGRPRAAPGAWRLAPAPAPPRRRASPRRRLPLGAAPAVRVPDRFHGPFDATPRDFPLGAPVAQVLDTYIIAVGRRRLAGAGGPARRA